MATLNEWFSNAKFKGLDLNKYIQVNQPSDLKRLKESGLPSFDLLIINGSEFDSTNAREFIFKYSLVWCRAVSKTTQRRFYKLGINGFEEFSSFIKSIHEKPENLLLQIFEYHENAFGGAIISSESKTIVEIAYGVMDNVTKSITPFFHGLITESGRLSFFEENVPVEVKKSALNALSYLKISRGNYMQGYFEFIVSKEGKIFFLDYKKGFPKIL